MNQTNVKLSFSKDITLLKKLTTLLESKFKSKFNYSLLFGILASRYLLFVDINDVNLYDLLKKTSTDFVIDRDSDPFTTTLVNSLILDSYLLEENTNFNFLYYMLSVLFLIHTITFYKAYHSTLDEIHSASLADIYKYFVDNNSIEYYSNFEHNRFYFYPLSCNDIFNITDRIINKYDNLNDFIEYVRTYEN